MHRSPLPRSGPILTATITVLAVASLAGALLPGCARMDGARSETPSVNLTFEKYTLPNGLEVILRKDSRLPIVAVNLWYHVGPANEAAGRTGFAHLFEHMMFQGSGHVGDDMFFKLLEGAGASFTNGTTDFDRTNYMEDVPANQLELALWLESDRMGFLLDKLNHTMLANQQDVVRNERRQSIENAPYQLGEEQLYHMLFPKGHPYYAMVIGSHTDIQAAKLDDVRDFFTRHYCPNNASLAIVGDIDVEKTKGLVEKYFGSIPRGPDVPPIEVQTPPITEERRATVTDQVELPRVLMAWITAPIFKPGDAEATLAARILGSGKASRLYKSLVYEKQIAQDVSAVQQPYVLGSIFEITVTAKPGHSAEELQAAIDAELDTLAQRGPTSEELAAAKNVIHSSIIRSLENVGSFGGVADRFNMYNQHLKDPGYLNKDLQRFAAVTTEDVKRVAAEALAKNKRVVVQIVPGEKVIPAGPPTPPAPAAVANKVESKEPWRNEIPKPGPPPSATLPSAKRFKLDNGLTVYLVESHGLPIVAANLAVRAGSAIDPPAMPGLGGFMTEMLDEGTSKRDALTIARDLEALGAMLDTDIGKDGCTVFTQSLKQNAAAALQIMADVALSPAFPEKEVERVRHDRLTSLQQDRDSPARIAYKVMWRDLYGPSHPYNHLVIGSEVALKQITRADLESFYKSSFAPANAALVLAGDLTEAEARRLAQEVFGKWSGTAGESPRPPDPTPSAERVLIADKPGSPQTMVLVAQPGIMRSDPDFEKANVMNTTLGGLFSARINMNLREKHGYTYGAYSQLWETRGVGPLTIAGSVATDVTGASIKEILNEVNGLRNGGVSDDELQTAKEFISRTLPAYFQNTASMVGTIAQLYEFDLPPDYYQGLPARLEAVTAADVHAAAQKHLQPEAMKVIAVGDRSKIERQIAGLKLGPVGFRNADGEPMGMTQAARP